MSKLALAFVLLAACTDTHGDPGPTEQTATQRLRFIEQTGSSYSFTYLRSCECLESSAGPFRIVVTDGVIASATDREGGAVLPEVLANLPTIEDLFDRIDEAYDRPADSIEVTFDPAAGYPTEVDIDYSTAIADEEFTAFISDVTTN
jgi:hypothetical protein